MGTWNVTEIFGNPRGRKRDADVINGNVGRGTEFFLGSLASIASITSSHLISLQSAGVPSPPGAGPAWGRPRAAAPRTLPRRPPRPPARVPAFFLLTLRRRRETGGLCVWGEMGSSLLLWLLVLKAIPNELGRHQCNQ